MSHAWHGVHSREEVTTRRHASLIQDIPSLVNADNLNTISPRHARPCETRANMMGLSSDVILHNATISPRHTLFYLLILWILEHAIVPITCHKRHEKRLRPVHYTSPPSRKRVIRLRDARRAGIQIFKSSFPLTLTRSSR